MVDKSATLDLKGAMGAFGTKKNIDNSFRLFFIGFVMLVVGCIFIVYVKNVILVYSALWIGFSGLIAMINSIFRLLKSIFYFG